MIRRLSFSKMQGVGNDFVVLDGVRERRRRPAEQHFPPHCADVRGQLQERDFVFVAHVTIQSQPASCIRRPTAA